MGTGGTAGEPWEHEACRAISQPQTARAYSATGTTGLCRSSHPAAPAAQPSQSAPGVESVCADLAGSKQRLRCTHSPVTAPKSRAGVAARPGAPLPVGTPLDRLLVLRGQELGDAVGDEADGGQWHSCTLAEGEDVEKQLHVGGWLEGIEEV